MPLRNGSGFTLNGSKTPSLSSPTVPSSPTRPSSMFYRPSSPSRSSSSLDSVSPAGDRIAVNVSVRIRPPLVDDDHVQDYQDGGPGSPKPHPRKAHSSVVESTTNNSVTVNRKKFAFDNVFDETTTQQGVWKYIGDCTAKFVQGYNVTIMAYGQSGSGKSYTMGTTDDPSTIKNTDIMGVTQRAASQLFLELKRGVMSSPPLQSGFDFEFEGGRGSPVPGSRLRPPSVNFSVKNRLMSGITSNGSGISSSSSSSSVNEALDCQPWAISVSYMEIYNEQLRDLLDAGNPNKKMTIREDVKGNIIVQGIKEVVVPDTESLLAVLEQGSHARQTNSTAINATSSRSHAIFSIHLTQKQLNPENGIITTVTSKLNLVDLAGSERIKNTGATNEGRVKEGISINSGLTSLGKVISQLSLNPNGSHVSYRDSKLTRALQDSIGGKAITYLIACITTESLYLSETLNTLSYAQRARSIQSSPEIQIVEASKEELLQTISRLQQDLSQMKRASNIQVQNESTPLSSPLLGSGQFQPLAPSTPSNHNSGQFYPMSPPTIESKERITRSTAFQNAVESIISDYELTVKSLQESNRVAKENNTELEDTLQQVRSQLVEAQEANQELGDLVEQLQARVEELLIENNQKSTSHEINDNDKDNDNNESRRKVEEEKSDEDVKNEAKLRETRITQLEKELVSYRMDQKRHSTESQYLTSQYNNSRKEVLKLTREKEELEARLRRYQAVGPTPSSAAAGNAFFKRRVSCPDVTEEEHAEYGDHEDDDSGDSSTSSSIGPETPPSIGHSFSQHKQTFTSSTSHRRNLSLASSSSSTEKTPRSERRRSSFFVRASVI